MANIICSIFGHTYPEELEHMVSPKVDHGFCEITHTCKRCGRGFREESKFEHQFQKKSDISIDCIGGYSSDQHTIWSGTLTKCIICGYEIFEREKKFYEECSFEERYCKESRKCYSCFRTIRVPVREHDFQLLGFVEQTNTCEEEYECKHCKGRISRNKKNHSFGEVTKLNVCEEQRTCQRCGYQQITDGHQWLKPVEIGRTGEYVEFYEDYCETVQLRKVCKICGKEMIEEESHWANLPR